jgi:hypothetical protein
MFIVDSPFSHSDPFFASSYNGKEVVGELTKIAIRGFLLPVVN